MKERFVSSLEKVSIVELQRFARSLDLSIVIGNTNKPTPKATLIHEIVNYLSVSDFYSLLYEFCSTGVLLFNAYSFEDSSEKTLFEEEQKEELLKSLEEEFHIVSLDYGIIYHPKQPIELFSGYSLFFPKDENFFILFKKYLGNVLSTPNSYKNRIESLFKIEVQPYMDNQLHFKVMNKLKNNDLIFNYDIDEKHKVMLTYVSHQFASDDIKISSRLNYMRAVSKDVVYEDDLTSEGIIEKFKLMQDLPAEVDYIVKIPNSTESTVRYVGINFILSNDKNATRYALVLKQNDFRIVNTNADLLDLYNVIKIFREHVTGSL